jgi:GAF domain-containing protein
LPESSLNNTLCVPLIAQGEAIGLLSFQNITRKPPLPGRIWS